MNVLSFFDGMSCGQVALQRAGVKVSKYYACEIDKYAMNVTQKNFPNTIQLGSITEVFARDLPVIDLLIGGSPCQGFSFAGKQLNFDDPRSKLFFEYVRVLKEIREVNPNVLFLLENVVMKKEYQEIITEYLGVKPVMVNSNLVSAQNRKRLYWTNITEIEQPEDNGILLRDIVHETVDYCLSEKEIDYMLRSSGNWSPNVACRFENYLDYSEKKAHCLTANLFKGVPYNCYLQELNKYIVPFEKTLKILEKEVESGKIGYFRKDSQANRVYFIHNKAVTLCGDAGGGADKMGQYLFGSVSREVHQVCESKESGGQQPYMQNRVYNVDGIAPCLTQVADRLNVAIPIQECLGIIQRPRGENTGGLRNDGTKSTTLSSNSWHENNHLLFGCISPDRIEKRQNGQRFNQGRKFYTLTAQDKHGILIEGYIRKLTPIECERLQTLPDNYSEGVSNAQRYKMLGNGWTVDVVAHIFKHINQ